MPDGLDLGEDCVRLERRAGWIGSVCYMVLELADYRRLVSDLYAGVRRRGVDDAAWRWWRQERQALLLSHPVSALSASGGWSGGPPAYFDYDPTWQVVARVVVDRDSGAQPMIAGDGERFAPVGTVEFDRRGTAHSLGVFWSESYAGGLFVPFRDRTNGDTTYGAGRYVLDTAKGADLGPPPGRDGSSGELLLDFNFAYHPSCVWDSIWQCPLAPQENHLDVAVEAGERKPSPVEPGRHGGRCERCDAWVPDGTMHDCC